MAAIFPIKFKMSKISPFIVDNSHIHLHFKFHANRAIGFETGVLNKNELTINTINLIGLGGKKSTKKYFFHRFQIFDFESLGSIATEILSRKRGAAAAAWYADQSNTSRQIFNSRREKISVQVGMQSPNLWSIFVYRWAVCSTCIWEGERVSVRGVYASWLYIDYRAAVSYCVQYFVCELVYRRYKLEYSGFFYF